MEPYLSSKIFKICKMSNEKVWNSLLLNHSFSLLIRFGQIFKCCNNDTTYTYEFVNEA